MVNAWSLLYEELNETMNEVYPIMSGVSTAKSEYYFDYDRNDPNRKSPFTFYDEDASPDTLNLGPISGAMGADTISFGSSVVGNDSITFSGSRLYGGGYDDLYYGSGKDHLEFTTKPQPDLKGSSNQKYKEDKGIKDLKDYVSSTYSGHYTNNNSDVQTLDLIHSVGDAESFCRSNALKYLSRYDKKGQAKRDILKAMHYCLLLYYFSGNTQNDEITTRGYETF